MSIQPPQLAPGARYQRAHGSSWAVVQWDGQGFTSRCSPGRLVQLA